MTAVYHPELRLRLLRAAEMENIEIAETATYVCTNGPRFETPSEIRMYKQLGAHVVGMTGYPEVALARELNVPYASIAVVSNLAAGMTDGAVEEDEIWDILEATKDPVFRLLSRSVQLQSSGEC